MKCFAATVVFVACASIGVGAQNLNGIFRVPIYQYATSVNVLLNGELRGSINDNRFVGNGALGFDLQSPYGLYEMMFSLASSPTIGDSSQSIGVNLKSFGNSILLNSFNSGSGAYLKATHVTNPAFLDGVLGIDALLGASVTSWAYNDGGIPHSLTFWKIYPEAYLSYDFFRGKLNNNAMTLGFRAGVASRVLVGEVLFWEYNQLMLDLTDKTDRYFVGFAGGFYAIFNSIQAFMNFLYFAGTVNNGLFAGQFEVAIQVKGDWFVLWKPEGGE